MKAPDKIYVASYNGEAFSHSWTIEPLGDITATEYIRKDVLLELIKNESNSWDDGEMIFRELIDKLNSI